jgi:hypothetical protein
MSDPLLTRRRAQLPSIEMIDLPSFESDISTATGAITEMTGGRACPFDIKRVYWIHGCRAGEIRGRHAHRSLSQLMVAMAGSFQVTLSDEYRGKTYRLDTPRRGLLVGPGYWRSIRVESAASVLMVAASAPFEEADYIRDRAEFLAYRKNLRAAWERSELRPAAV